MHPASPLYSVSPLVATFIPRAAYRLPGTDSSSFRGEMTRAIDFCHPRFRARLSGGVVNGAQTLTVPTLLAFVFREACRTQDTCEDSQGQREPAQVLQRGGRSPRSIRPL